MYHFQPLVKVVTKTAQVQRKKTETPLIERMSMPYCKKNLWYAVAAISGKYDVTIKKLELYKISIMDLRDVNKILLQLTTS